MEIIVDYRQSGKTLKVIELAAKSGAYIVCINHRECDRVASLARCWGKKIKFPLCPDEFFLGKYHNQEPIIFDNLDMILQQFSPSPILAVTMTREDHGLKCHRIPWWKRWIFKNEYDKFVE